MKKIDSRKVMLSNGEIYLLETFRSVNRLKPIHNLSLSKDGGESWGRLKFKLSFKSCCRLYFNNNWPPAQIDKIEQRGDTVCIVYKDPSIPFDKPMMPWGLDKESEWRATYNKNSQRWILDHLGFIQN
jgi:hypothetical protein